MIISTTKLPKDDRPRTKALFWRLLFSSEARRLPKKNDGNQPCMNIFVKTDHRSNMKDRTRRGHWSTWLTHPAPGLSRWPWTRAAVSFAVVLAGVCEWIVISLSELSVTRTMNLSWTLFSASEARRLHKSKGAMSTIGLVRTILQHCGRGRPFKLLVFPGNCRLEFLLFFLLVCTSELSDWCLNYQFNDTVKSAHHDFALKISLFKRSAEPLPWNTTMWKILLSKNNSYMVGWWHTAMIYKSS